MTTIHRAEIERLLRPADALIVVPPFCDVPTPSLGAHVLQACAKYVGATVRVLYANVLFCRISDWQLQRAGPAAPLTFFGERLFARSAYGVPPLGHTALDVKARSSIPAGFDEAYELESRAATWVRELGELLAALERFPVIGFTTTFQQTAASIAIANAVKHADPRIITIIGGANCDGDMGDGIARLSSAIDYVFKGESEATFPTFLAEVARGHRPNQRVISGTPCRDLSTIPMPDFDDYAAQKQAWLTGGSLVRDEEVWLPYETSRGCWWGERHHCTFCGLNAQGMAHRVKPADLVVRELRALTARYPFRRVMMTDNIMPYGFFKTLIPRLTEASLDCTVFYEQKSNLGLRHLVALERAGICVIQPGIEALSTDLLRLMDKGVSARQNVAMLRYARAVGVIPVWNLLFDFPGDRLEWYEQTLKLLPLIRHLHPPGGMLKLRIDRFSPYFERPETFAVRQLWPLPDYSDFLPAGFDAGSIAYYFTADYSSEWRDRDGATATLPRLFHEIGTWRAMWEGSQPPELSLARIAPRHFRLRDTRRLADGPVEQIVEAADVSRLLKPRRLDVAPDTRQALEQRLAVALDGYYVPLVTADVDVLAAVELDDMQDDAAAAVRVTWHRAID
jgi:ribosomal peptide maturation radical SAM protein 1